MPSVEPVNGMAPPVTQVDSNMGGLDQPMTSAVMPSGYNILRSEPDSMMNPSAYPSGGTMPVAQTGGTLDYGQPGYGGVMATVQNGGTMPVAQTGGTLDYGQPGYGGTGFGAYGMGRTSNPYTIGTGGMPQTSPYFRGFNNPYSGGFGGKGGGMSPGQTYQPDPRREIPMGAGPADPMRALTDPYYRFTPATPPGSTGFGGMGGGKGGGNPYTSRPAGGGGKGGANAALFPDMSRQVSSGPM
jgi:hypothetical protein